MDCESHETIALSESSVESHSESDEEVVQQEYDELPQRQTESSNDEQDRHPDSTPPKKRKNVRGSNYFNEAWLREFQWFQKYDPKSKFSEAFCKICRSNFSVQNKGHSALSRHEKTQKHTALSKSAVTNNVMGNFFSTKTSTEQDQITAIEIAQIYHAVKHNISYNSTDCEIKLIKHTVSDSNLAKQINCGRTKCTAMVTNVLAPFQLEQDISYLKDNQVFFLYKRTRVIIKTESFFPFAYNFFLRRKELILLKMQTKLLKACEIW